MRTSTSRGRSEITAPGSRIRRARAGAAALAFTFLLSLGAPHAAEPAEETRKGAAPRTRVQSLTIRILSTMLADEGIGEWGFAALVEADGRRILFDTGNLPDTVLRNVRTLGVDLSGVETVVLSHNHGDHTGGLVTLRREHAAAHPGALSRTHVAAGIFASRSAASGGAETNSMIRTKADYEETGGVFVVHDGPARIAPGVWVTGPVPRIHPERNWSGGGRVRTPDGWVEDTIPEDQSLVIETPRGLVILSGCGHSGIVNTIAHARKAIADEPVYAALGGFHLLEASDEHLQWTSERLREGGVRHFLGAHCTGIEAVYQIRARAGLARGTCIVGAVGASFDLEAGLRPGWLAR